MTAKVITSMPELVAAIRARRDELNLSHEAIDAIAGFQSGYTSKLLSPNPIRNIGYMSLGSLLGALGVALVVVEDATQRAKVESRWCQRRRPPKREHAHGALIEEEREQRLSSTIGDNDVQATFEFPTETRTCRSDQSGGVARPAAGEPVFVEFD